MGVLLGLGLVGIALAGISLARRSQGTSGPSRSTPAAGSSPPAPPVGQGVESPLGSGAPPAQGVAREHQVADESGAGISPPSLGDWARLLAAPCLARHIQLPYAVRWIELESGGNPCEVGDPRSHGPDGYPRELGIAQFYNPDDLTQGHATGAQLRAYCVPGQHPVTYKGQQVLGFLQVLTRPLTDLEMLQQVDLTVALISRSMAAATRDLAAIHAGAAWSPDGRDYWTLVKLQHGLPGISRSGLPAVTKKLGRPPRSWQEFRATLSSVTLDAGTERYRGIFPEILDNAEHAAQAFTPAGVA